MQRQEFVQQLWLDYVHTHPDIGALRLWPLSTAAEYLTLVTLNYGPFAAAALTGNLAHMGYRVMGHYAMADKGLLVQLLAPSDGSSWLVLAELQIGTLSKAPRKPLKGWCNNLTLRIARGIICSAAVAPGRCLAGRFINSYSKLTPWLPG